MWVEKECSGNLVSGQAVEGKRKKMTRNPISGNEEKRVDNRRWCWSGFQLEGRYSSRMKS